jgi:hypothetical protein
MSKEAFPTLPTSTFTRPVPVWKHAQSQTVTERFEIPSNLLVIILLIQARPQLGKLSSTSQICKDTMLKFKSKIEYSTNVKSASITFLVSGSAEAVKQSKKQLVRLLSAKVTDYIMVPSSVRPFIVGKQGAVLKRLTSETGTQIQVPKFDENLAESEDDEIIITITGNLDDIQEAKCAIDAIVQERSLNYRKRLEIERSFHRLLSGANKSNIKSLENEFDVKIHIPPFDTELSAEAKPNEIVIVGDRSKALQCEAKILKQFEELVKININVEIIYQYRYN